MGGRIIVAGDPLGSNGYTGYDLHDKVVDGNGFSIAWTGSYKVAELIEDKVLTKKPTPMFTSLAQVRTFCYSLQESLVKYGRVNATSSTTHFPVYDFSLIIASPYGLWYVQNDLSAFEAKTFCALGSGGTHAEAAMATILRMKAAHNLPDIDAKYLVETAIKVADEFVVSVNSNVWCREYAQKPKLKKVEVEKEEAND